MVPLQVTNISKTKLVRLLGTFYLTWEIQNDNKCLVQCIVFSFFFFCLRQYKLSFILTVQASSTLRGISPTTIMISSLVLLNNYFHNFKILSISNISLYSVEFWYIGGGSEPSVKFYNFFGNWNILITLRLIKDNIW